MDTLSCPDRPLRALRRQVRILQVALVGLGIVLLLGATQAKSADVLRVRGIIVVDDAGRERILLGAPVPDAKDGPRNPASTGLVINDPNGWERFSLGYTDDDRMTMGFDAPPGINRGGSRERINLGVYPDGGLFFRFRNHRGAPSVQFTRTGDDPDVTLSMIRWGEDNKVAWVRKHDANGEQLDVR